MQCMYTRQAVVVLMIEVIVSMIMVLCGGGSRSNLGGDGVMEVEVIY